jgi:hypothetical protein
VMIKRKVFSYSRVNWALLILFLLCAETENKVQRKIKLFAQFDERDNGCLKALYKPIRVPVRT